MHELFEAPMPFSAVCVDETVLQVLEATIAADRMPPFPHPRKYFPRNTFAHGVTAVQIPRCQPNTRFFLLAFRFALTTTPIKSLPKGPKAVDGEKHDGDKQRTMKTVEFHYTISQYIIWLFDVRRGPWEAPVFADASLHLWGHYEG